MASSAASLFGLVVCLFCSPRHKPTSPRPTQPPSPKQHVSPSLSLPLPGDQTLNPVFPTPSGRALCRPGALLWKQTRLFRCKLQRDCLTERLFTVSRVLCRRVEKKKKVFRPRTEGLFFLLFNCERMKSIRSLVQLITNKAEKQKKEKMRLVHFVHHRTPPAPPPPPPLLSRYAYLR